LPFVVGTPHNTLIPAAQLPHLHHTCVPVSVLLPFSLFFSQGSGDRRVLHFSLHDALPIYAGGPSVQRSADQIGVCLLKPGRALQDRKSTRLNSSHVKNSYAVFCLKKKRKYTS